MPHECAQVFNRFFPRTETNLEGDDTPQGRGQAIGLPSLPLGATKNQIFITLATDGVFLLPTNETKAAAAKFYQFITSIHRGS